MNQNKKAMTVDVILIVAMIGILAGVLSGLVGIGGGIVLVPALVFFFGYTQHQAQGTSLGVLSFPVVLIGFLTYYHEMKKQGQPIDFKVVGILAAGFIIGVYAGSHIAVRLDKELMKKIFACILLFTAFKMLNIDTAIARFFKSVF